ncbi:MAG: hypothetical protein U5K79_25760 [Cyclobacteriaceae bacterium]|nr:hypothetical protein [Cyclobacteriaceae bacterium]
MLITTFSANTGNVSIIACYALKTQKKYGGGSYPNRMLASIGNGYSQMHQVDTAIYYFKIASDESKKRNDKYALATIYGEMVDIIR